MKNTPFKLRSGNRAAYSDLQKESPVKALPLIPAIAAFLKGTAAKIASTKIGGMLLTATGKGAATKIGLTKTGQAVASGLISGGRGRKKGIRSIMEGEQPKIMRDNEKSV